MERMVNARKILAECLLTMSSDRPIAVRIKDAYRNSFSRLVAKDFPFTIRENYFSLSKMFYALANGEQLRMGMETVETNPAADERVAELSGLLIDFYTKLSDWIATERYLEHSSTPRSYRYPLAF